MVGLRTYQHPDKSSSDEILYLVPTPSDVLIVEYVKGQFVLAGV